MKNFSAPFIFVLLVGMAAVSLLRAQLPQGLSGKKISYAFQDPKTLKLKAIFTGQNAKQVTGSQVLVSEFAMKTFRNGDTNQVELIVEAPECLVDRNNSVASSPGRLKAYTASTNFLIEGEGFFCQQTNALLIISNKVETTIRKDLLKSRSVEKTPQPTPGLSDSTNQFLKIYADHFEFLYESNLVIYTGNVLVTDPQIGLTCDLLTIFLTTNKTIQKITAANHVVIVNKKDGSIATGDEATYVLNGDEESIELTGHPTWRDGQRDGKADRFVFDRKNNIFRAEKNAVFKLPREKIGQPGLLNSNASSTNAQTGKPVEISADLFTFKLAETNGPVQEIIAEKNVVILSESDQSRATGDKAIYNEETGLVQLTGNPVWKNNQNEIKADILAIGKTNQFFSAKTNVSMKLPATLFKRTLAAGAANTATVTNEFIQIFCNEFSYATNTAEFSENVRATLLDENGSQTTLRCDFAKVSFGPGNQVETVFADKNVVLEEIPGPALRTNVLKKTLACELLTVNRSAKTGLLESIHAETKVVGEQIERAALGEVVKRISADVVDAKFSPTTNQIETVVAERNVLIEKIEPNKSGQASGEKAVYRMSAGQEVVELTGHPSARTETMLFSDALVMLWNLKSGKISAMPYKVTPLNATNNLKPLRKISQP
ncbi:MAG: LptA/OstA family protein [Verrucomicrobiota bacterium]